MTGANIYWALMAFTALSIAAQLGAVHLG